jgi:hypothetical protein
VVSRAKWNLRGFTHPPKNKIATRLGLCLVPGLRGCAPMGFVFVWCKFPCLASRWVHAGPTAPLPACCLPPASQLRLVAHLSLGFSACTEMERAAPQRARPWAP